MICTLVLGGSVCLVGVLPHQLTAPARSVLFLPCVTTTLLRGVAGNLYSRGVVRKKQAPLGNALPWWRCEAKRIHYG